MNIGICLYHSKPLGTPKEDYEYALYHCYRPILTYLYTKEQVNLSLHLSGNIFEWLEATYPEINMLILDLIKRGQIELIGGGYYDPPFAFIPVKDRSTHIEKLNTYLRKRFGKKPKGAVIPEHVWQPHLVTTLNSCDIAYVISFDPDEPNKQKRPSGWYEPYTMIDNGKQITVLPASSVISDAVAGTHPEETVSRIIHELNASESSSMMLLVSADDLISSFMLADIGSMIEFIDELFTLLKQHGIQLKLPGSMIHRSRGRISYLPGGWYHPLMIHDRSADIHDMLLRYPESFRAYCRLHYLHRLVSGVKKDKARKKSADQELLKAQSSLYFWPGRCGGIYRNSLRKRQYSHLIEAEKMTRERGVFVTALNNYDIDYDGIDEYVYRGKHITVMIDRTGASVGELDYLVTSWNYQDTFTGCGDDGCMVSPVIYPASSKQHSFTDLFFQEPAKNPGDKFHRENCRSLEGELYKLTSFSKESKIVGFAREESLPLPGCGRRIHIDKQYRFKSNSVEVDYLITNQDDEPLSVYFCSEMNLSFYCDGPEFLEISSIDSSNIKMLGDAESLEDVRYLRIYDVINSTQVGLYSKQRFLVMNSSYSTTITTSYGEEEVYQHSVFRLFWKLDLPPREIWGNTLGLRIEKRNKNRRKKNDRRTEA